MGRKQARKARRPWKRVGTMRGGNEARIEADRARGLVPAAESGSIVFPFIPCSPRPPSDGAARRGPPSFGAGRFPGRGAAMRGKSRSRAATKTRGGLNHGLGAVFKLH